MRPLAYVDPPPRPAFTLPTAPPGKRLISLAINESPFGASPMALAAARNRLETPNRYPDPSSAGLRQAIAEVHGLDPRRLVCGNGSEELLDVIGRMFARPGDEIIMSQSGFFQFALVAARCGASLVRAPEKDFQTDVAAVIASVAESTKLVFLAIPNNPTGLVLGADEVQALHRLLPDRVVLVLDLAYGEYLPEQDLAALIRMAAENDNVIATRTLSKAHGLAALRAGWLLAPEWMIPGLNLLRGVGSVNAVAQAAAEAAVRDLDFVAWSVAQTALQRTVLAAGLTRLGLHFLPGLGNFLLTRFPDGQLDKFLHAAMAEEGIWLRPVGEPGFTGWSRLGIGTPAETDLLLAVLERFLMTGRGRLK